MGSSFSLPFILHFARLALSLHIKNESKADAQDSSNIDVSRVRLSRLRAHGRKCAEGEVSGRQDIHVPR